MVLLLVIAKSFGKWVDLKEVIGNSSPRTISSLWKWNESGFRPPLCTCRLNWARRTSWGWWDDWDDTVLQTQDSKFEPWRSEAEHATSRSRRLPTILTFTRGWGRNIFCFFETAETGNRTPNSGVKGSGANHYPRAPAPAAYGFWWSNTSTDKNWAMRTPPEYTDHICMLLKERPVSKLFAKIQLIIAEIWFCEHNWHKVAELIIPRRSETSLVVLGK